MCNHSELIYIGNQEVLNGKSLPLYNCLKCHSTISGRNLARLRASSKKYRFSEVQK